VEDGTRYDRTDTEKWTSASNFLIKSISGGLFKPGTLFDCQLGVRLGEKGEMKRMKRATMEVYQQ
jgi:hypothetical protein